MAADIPIGTAPDRPAPVARAVEPLPEQLLLSAKAPALTPAARPQAPAVELPALLVGAREAARLCGLSSASWFRLKAGGTTPAPLKLGGRRLYRVEDLKLWVALGCPSRREFEAVKSANGRG